MKKIVFTEIDTFSNLKLAVVKTENVLNYINLITFDNALVSRSFLDQYYVKKIAHI